jgi:tricarballylate dehydrogenase
VTYDVVVVGGGNAALTAAISARRKGASVLMLERADPFWRGGNSKYTRNIRVVHAPGDRVMTDEYSEEELLQDLCAVSGEGVDLELAKLTIARSRELPAWMEEQGAHWQPAMRGTLQLARTNRFFLGGGKALVNAYYRTADALGVEVRYGADVCDLELTGGACRGVLTRDGSIACRAVVVASGGFEANLEWLREHWGDAVDGFRVRGSRLNDGSLLRRLLDVGAESKGDPRSFHAIAVDARSPKFDGGIATRVDSVPFSVMLNAQARRFYDEGEDLWPKRYATWGRLIAEQPGQRAFSIYDSKVAGKFMSGAYPPYTAPTLEELAAQVGLDGHAVARAVAEYNAAVVDGSFDPTRLDGCHTEHLSPAKSNWAQRVDSPPYHCFPLVPGITFTYLGVGVDPSARVRLASGGVFENVFAAGEVMAGNLLLRGYLGGFGMTIGTVFGRIAGEEAAAYARR